MVEVEEVETSGWRAAIRGMRNPKNSWNKSDSEYCDDYAHCHDCTIFKLCPKICENKPHSNLYVLGHNDLDLATRLIKAGPEHRKFLRMIHVQMDITAPLYWWKEMDTYKVGTTANSCSTMHKIHEKEFTIDDFSHENLIVENDVNHIDMIGWLQEQIKILNEWRLTYLDLNGSSISEKSQKKYWWQMIQLLPSSYNQLRTWDGSMETVLSILHQRKHHKLTTDWEPFRQTCFKEIPYCKEFYEALYGKEE